MTSSTEKSRENRLRRFAKIQGFTLVKSPRRDPRAWDYGLWWAVSDGTYEPEGVFGSPSGAVGEPPGLTLDEIENLLYGDSGGE